MSGLTTTRTPGIYRTPNGRYQVRVRDSRGSMVERTFDTMADAKAFKVKIAYEKQTGLDLDRRAAQTTFKDYAEGWRARQPQHQPSTKGVVEGRLRLHVYPSIGHLEVGAVRPVHLERLVAHLADNLAPTSVHGVVNTVATVFNDAVLRQVIARSPTIGLKRPALPARNIQVPSVVEVQSLIQAVDERYRALLLVLVGSGLRISEALALTEDRIDFGKLELRIDRQLSLVGSLHTFSPLKNNRPRRVPVPRGLIVELQAHRLRYGLGPDGLLFTNRAGAPIKRTSFSNGPWTRALIRAPGTRHMGVHGLRHFYASALIEHGESVRTVADRLGHRDVKETLDTYTHLWPSADDKTRSIVATLLDPSPQNDSTLSRPNNLRSA